MSDENAAFINLYRREITQIVNRSSRTLPKKKWREATLTAWTMFASSLEVEPDGAGLPCILQATRELMTPL